MLSDRRGFVRTGAATFASQAFSSASTILLIVAVSRGGNAVEVGRVAMAALAFQIGLGTMRSLFGEVALVRRQLIGSLDPAPMLVAAAITASCIGLLFLVVGLVGGAATSAIAALGVVFPALAVQDSLRYVAFATARHTRAACSDAIWLAGSALLVASGWASGEPSSQIVLVWGAFGSLALLPFLPWANPRVPRGVRRWALDSFPIARSYLPDYVLVLLSTAVPPIAVAAIGGVVAVGHLRLALAFLGPVTISWVAVMNLATPWLARNPRQATPAATLLSAGGVAAVLAWGIVGFAMPTGIGSRLIGDTWIGARSWVPWIVLGQAALAAFGGPVVGLRSIGRSATILSIRGRLFPVLAVAPCLGFAVANRAGYGIGQATAGLLATFMFWRSLLATSDRGVRSA